MIITIINTHKIPITSETCITTHKINKKPHPDTRRTTEKSTQVSSRHKARFNKEVPSHQHSLNRNIEASSHVVYRKSHVWDYSDYGVSDERVMEFTGWGRRDREGIEGCLWGRENGI